MTNILFTKEYLGNQL